MGQWKRKWNLLFRVLGLGVAEGLGVFLGGSASQGARLKGIYGLHRGGIGVIWAHIRFRVEGLGTSSWGTPPYYWLLKAIGGVGEVLLG